jgi:hypothetical protein
VDTEIAKTAGCRLMYLSGVVGVSDRAQKSHANFLSPTFTLFYPFSMFHLFLPFLQSTCCTAAGTHAARRRTK